MARLPLSISLEENFVDRIDEVKGKNEPRSRFIEDIIAEFLAKNKGQNALCHAKKTTNLPKRRES